MLFKNILTLASASLASAQSLTQALASQNASLSTLNGLLAQNPQLAASLAQVQNVTVLAPSNAALQKVLGNPALAASLSNPSAIAALLSYHIVNGTRYASQLGSSAFLATHLTAPAYTNITTGQRVHAVARNGSVSLVSGLKASSSVVTANVNFTGGTIHIIDTVLTVPPALNTTLFAANLSVTASALNASGVLTFVSRQRSSTLFIPRDAYAAVIANYTRTLDLDALTSVFGYHIVNGTLAYSTDLLARSQTTLKTWIGRDLTISVVNGTVYANSVRVVGTDYLYASGVVHIIDGVLNPNSTGTVPPASPTATATSSPVATVSRAAGVPVHTAAVAMAGLFAGAGMFANL